MTSDMAHPLVARRTRRGLRRLVRTPSGVVGLALSVVVAITGLLADTLAPHDPFSPVGPSLSPPSGSFPMGTDDLGRDVLSGVVHGARASLLIGLGVAAVVAVIGLVVGIVSGYLGGRVDDALMRTTEAFQTLPRFFLALVVIALFGPGLVTLVAVLGFTSWAIVARVVRAETLSLRQAEFVLAARAMGASLPRVLFRHILPNVVPSVVTFVSLVVAQAILVEASLGFLGFADPSRMSWGILAGNAQSFIRSAWWLGVFPGGAIALAVLGINLLGDGLLEAEQRRRLGGSRAAVHADDR